MRYFDGQPIELLAPAGTFLILKEVVKTNCDAIYFGGRILNMRMIRKGYNLSDEEVVEAVKLIHSYNKKAYITINNLNSVEDLEEARDYLKFLNDEAKPDALIVQDMAIIELIEEMNLNLEIHSSVMMNVHNIETIKALQDRGVTRVVVSRDFTLNDVKLFKKACPTMEFEYFTHGDMCSVHGSQCYLSSFMFGMSSNRGRCLKPCRWWYKIKKDGNIYDAKFPLAVKDMSLFEYLPELIASGVTSFKIEGRMREVEFICQLINWYGDAIDRYINDPLSYNRKVDFDKIYESRKRDLSSGYALGKPGLSYINERFEGTGKFYSTGRMFSTPTVEKEIDEAKIINLSEKIRVNKNTNNNKLNLAVKVNNFEQALLCINKGVNRVILSGDVYLPSKGFSVDEIKALTTKKGNSKIILGTPKIFDELDFSRYNHLLKNNDLNLDGVSVSNLGALTHFKQFDLPMYSDSAMNLYNDLAIKYYSKQGLGDATLSIELPISDLIHTIKNSVLPTEIIAHGLIDVMHLELDLEENTKVLDIIDHGSNQYVSNDTMVLVNEAGEFPIYKDIRGRNHLHNTKELNLLPIINDLRDIGLETVRIEGQVYSNNQLENVIDAYQKVINENLSGIELIKHLEPNFAGFTLGSLNHEVK